MHYLRTIYINNKLTGHNNSFTEHQNLSYGVLLGFISPWNIVITTLCIGWGSSSVFIKPQKSNNFYQNNDSPQSIMYLVITSSEYSLHLLLRSQKASLIRWISPTN